MLLSNTMSMDQETVETCPVDHGYVQRLCDEMNETLLKKRETGLFLFLYRYFQTLIKQERLQEARLLLNGIERYAFDGHAESVITLTTYVKAYLQMKEPNAKAAARCFRETLENYKQLERLGISNVQVLCYKELGNIDFAEKRYKDAIEKYQLGIDHLKLNQDSEYLLAILLYNTSLCYFYLKNYHQAVEYLDKSIRLSKDTSNSYLLLDALIMKSVLLTEHYKKYAEANKLLEDAYQIAERNQHHSSINQIWNNWAYNFFHLKQYLLAEQALQHSIRLSKEYGDERNRLRSELQLSELWIELGQKERAKGRLEWIRGKTANSGKYTSEWMKCLELLALVESDIQQQKKYVETAYQLAKEQKNYQKTEKLREKLSKFP